MDHFPRFSKQKKLIFLFFVLAVAPLTAQNTPSFREAVVLELQGRLGEALEKYRQTLDQSDPKLGDSKNTLALSKIAALCIDLGRWEEAWDASSRLLSFKDPASSAEGTAIRVRLYGLQGRTSDAWNAYQQFGKSYPLITPPTSLIYQTWKALGLQRTFAAEKNRLAILLNEFPESPETLLVKAVWDPLESPSSVMVPKVLESQRLQLGAYQDWSNALTQANLLKEKGWVPQIEKRVSGGKVLFAVYILSRQPDLDKKRLKSQGFDSYLSP